MSDARNLQYVGFRGIAALIVFLSHMSGRERGIFFGTFMTNRIL